MNYSIACLLILSSFGLIAPATARWVDVSGTTNDGATLSFDTNEIGRTRFVYRVVERDDTRAIEGVTSWCYRGKIRLNPNAAPTTDKPGWYVYNKDEIVSVYANSPASLNLLQTVCAGQ
jgi:hypothetical protein